MSKRCMHQIIERVSNECFLLTSSISKISWVNDLDTVQTMKFKMNNGKNYYFATLHGFKHEFEFNVTTDAIGVKCSLSVFTGSGTLLFSSTLKQPTKIEQDKECSTSHYDLMLLSHEDECFQRLKQHGDDSLVLICRIICSEKFHSDSDKSADEATNSSTYMKGLADALRNSSESSLKEKVTLRVGDETETVNKAILCARSPMFANIFQSNMELVKDNVVTISDITMPVLKALISFLYTGKLPYSDSDIESNGDIDIDFLCDIYRAADKYGITELRRTCVNLLLPRISIENIFEVSKVAFALPDERLKSTVKTLIAANIETLVDEEEWKDFMKDHPQIVVEALTFFDI